MLQTLHDQNETQAGWFTDEPARWFADERSTP